MKTEKFIANAQYCEDVRNEIGGAQTYVGVMRGTLAFPELPASIPKFAIILDVCVDASMEQSPVEFRVITVRDDGSETEIARETMPFDSPELSGQSIGRYHAISGVVAFAPLIVQEPTSLYVKITHEGQEYIPPGLRFAVNPSGSSGAS